MSLLTNLLGLSYMLAATVLAVYSASFFILMAIYFVKRSQPPVAPQVSDDELLSVTLQLPIYNEQHVVDRLIDAMGALDYPRDRLAIQVLDDSTDETTEVVRKKVEEWKARGLTIDLIRRPDRTGYKAGALAYGLALSNTDCVGIFDADFVPEPSFLRKVMPHFNTDPNIALVSALNAGSILPGTLSTDPALAPYMPATHLWRVDVGGGGSLDVVDNVWGVVARPIR